MGIRGEYDISAKQLRRVDGVVTHLVFESPSLHVPALGLTADGQRPVQPVRWSVRLGFAFADKRGNHTPHFVDVGIGQTVGEFCLPSPPV